MMKFRRSMKNEKHDSAKSQQITIPPKDAIAIEPPKKVIKALYDYAAPAEPRIYLSFSAGDFLHVVGREHDTDWYEACNPLRNERGLVPVNYFEELGKTVRDSGDSSNTVGSATHDSGFSEGASAPAAIQNTAAPRMTASNVGQPTPAAHARGKSIGKVMGGVYGVVAFDFHAERPDELDAKEGEAIIVIAQSNPEWFVAKPITRLGGPGLIPVSFIEIRDMTTGQIAEDPVAAVAKAGIPKVEEWKRMAAEYKNTSIPLGTVTSSQTVQSLQQSVDRMSINSTQHTQNGFGSQHTRDPSRSLTSQDADNTAVPVRASVPRFIFIDDKYHFIVECQLSDGSHWDLSRIYEDFYELQINLINAYPAEAGQVAGQPRILPYMPGPVAYVTDSISDGRRTNLDEYLRDLLRLQPYITSSALVRRFFTPRNGDCEVDPQRLDLNEHARPSEGNTTAQRLSNASQATYASAAQQQQQQQQQRSYPPHHQYSASQQSVAGASYPQRSRSPGASRSQNHTPSHSTTSLSYNTASNSASSAHHHTRGTQSSASAAGYMSSNAPSHPSLSRQTTNMSSLITTSSSNAPPTIPSAPVKVKAWFDRDTCVVLRMAPRGQFGFNDLYRKVIERRRLEYKGRKGGGVSNLDGRNGGPDADADADDYDPSIEDIEMEYRDENTGEYYRIEGDEDLDVALERCEKLTLAIRPRGSD